MSASASTRLESVFAAPPQYQWQIKVERENLSKARLSVRATAAARVVAVLRGMDCTAGRRLRSDSLRYGAGGSVTHDAVQSPDRDKINERTRSVLACCCNVKRVYLSCPLPPAPVNARELFYQ